MHGAFEGLHRFPLQLKSLTQCSPLRTCGGSHHSGSKRYVASHIHGITRCRPRAWPWGGDAFAVLRCRSVLVMQMVSEHGMCVCVCGFLSCCVSVTRVLRSVMSDHLVGLTESSSARMPPTPPAFIAAPQPTRTPHTRSQFGWSGRVSEVSNLQSCCCLRT